MKEKREIPLDKEELPAPISYGVCCLKDRKIRRGGYNYRKKYPITKASLEMFEISSFSYKE